MTWVLAALLFPVIIWDIRYKEIPLWYFFLIFVFAFLGQYIIFPVFQQGNDFCVGKYPQYWKEIIRADWLSVGMGAILFLIGLKKESGLGAADGITFLWLACFCRWNEMICLILVSFGIASVEGIVMILFFHRKKKDTIAFTPAVFMAYLFVIICFGGLGEYG